MGDWSNIAGIIVEPVMSAGGMLIPPPGYLAKLRRLTQQHGALLIVDEAQTGFGRTGKWFAIEHHDVEPDILTISKSAGNGFPVASVITTPEIADLVVSKGLWNLSSHQSDPVGAAAVSAVIDIVREEKLMERATDAGAYFMGQLRELCRKHRVIGNARGQGLMIGFDLLLDDPVKAANFANDFMYTCRSHGVHLTFGYGDRSFRIIPPLTISHAEIDFAIQVIEQCLTELSTDRRSKHQDWPKNAFTSRLWQRRRVTQLASRLWRSTPEQWLDKAKTITEEKLGLG